MSRIPDFAWVELNDTAGAGVRSRSATDAWLTPEGISVQRVYGPDDLAGLDFLNTYPGIPPYLRGPYPTMYVTQPWTVPVHFKKEPNGSKWDPTPCNAKF